MSKLLTCMDLADRWSMTMEQVERTVRELGVPFVELRSRKTRVSWENLRFRPESIEAWEAAREDVHPCSRAKRPASRPALSPRVHKHLGEY